MYILAFVLYDKGVSIKIKENSLAIISYGGIWLDKLILFRPMKCFVLWIAFSGMLWKQIVCDHFNLGNRVFSYSTGIQLFVFCINL